MQDVKRYLQAARELWQLQANRGTSEYFDHCEAITVAALVVYCRPFKFSRTEGYADKLLDPEALELFIDRPDLGAFHKLLIERRDRAVAHGDWEYHKTELVSRNYKDGVLRRSPVPNMTADIPPEKFSELAEYVGAKCFHRGFDLDRRQPLSDQP